MVLGMPLYIYVRSFTFKLKGDIGPQTGTSGDRGKQPGIEVKWADPDKSWDMLAKHFGLIKDVLAVKGDINYADMARQDRYKRTLGDIFLGARWINLELVEEGYTWHYKHYSKDKRLAQAEARAAKRGLWADTTWPLPLEHNKLLIMHFICL